MRLDAGDADDSHMASRRNPATVALLTSLIALATPAAAQAAQRYATPSGGMSSGSCSSLAPCTLQHAIESGAANDEVIVKAGDYVVGQAITASQPLDIHGEIGQPRPRLVGGLDLGSALLVLKVGGSVRRLAIEASGYDVAALTLENTLGEDLLLSSSGGSAAKVVASPGITVLRDTVAISTAALSAGLKLKDGSSSSAPGDIALRNVSVYASAGDGIRCETALGESTLVNVAVRGALTDIEASGAGVRCVSSHSAYRPASSPGKVLGTGDRGDDPGFANVATGDLHLLAGSALIDAGTSDSRLGPADPDGRSRTATGSAPDIGAYEAPSAAAPDSTSTSTSTPTSGTPSADSGQALPVLGDTVVLTPAVGNVRFRAPGTRRFVVLDGSTPVPTGSEIDARRGTVTLRSALPGGGSQTGRFRGGRFRVRQSPTGRGMTDLYLSGRELKSCPRVTRGRAATASRRRAKRRLWASDKGGRFRTHGANSVATARGTAWLTEDRCGGTLTRVTEGAVSVRLPSGRSVLVRAGKQRFVRARIARKGAR